MNAIDTDQILLIDKILNTRAQKGVFAASEILSPLKRLGFFSCCFYEAAYNIATEDYQLVLSAVEGIPEQQEYIGHKVKYEHTAIGRFPNSKSPILQEKNDTNQSDELKKHTLALATCDKNRVHTPIYIEEDLIGALSCSWVGDIDLISAEHIAGFKLIGSLLTQYWSISNAVLTNKLIHDIEEDLRSPDKYYDIDSLINSICELTLRSLQVQIAAIFEYNWYTSNLTKITESYAPDVMHEWSTENYPVNSCLTGTAWNDSRFCHIVDFHEFQEKFNVQINEQSLKHHTRILGDVRTILYYPFGGDNRYFIRLFNRDDVKSLPFFSSHKIILTGICDRLTKVVDDVITDHRLTRLQTVAKSVITNIGEPSLTLEEVKKSLEPEFIDCIGLMAGNLAYGHFSHKYFTNPNMAGKISDFIVWQDDRFFKACIDKDDVSVIPLSDYESRNNQNHLTGYLYNMGIKFVLVVPFKSVRVTGFLIIPIPPNSPGTTQSIISRIPLHQKASLRTHAAILGGCIEGADSYINIEKSDNLIGTLGHEIRGPIAKLGQSAIFVLYEAIGIFEVLAKEYKDMDYEEKLDVLRSEELKVSKQMQDINTLMSVAIDLAQQAGGIIQTHFEKTDLYVVMKSASDEVSEIDYYDYKGNKHKVAFIYNEASKHMPPLVIDKGLIRRVFVNVFNNAHKYSLPPGHGEPIRINIYGIPQSNLNIVQVENWGIAIPSDLTEKIFIPFQRGLLRDPRKARGGMGLGLYISRKFMAINSGIIFCKESKATFGDRDRRAIEGWKTVFEMRLPLDLKEGTYEANF